MPSLVTTGAAFCYALPFLLVFLVVSVGVGWTLLRAIGVRRHSSTAERSLIALLLGAAALQFVPFSLGAAGALSAVSLRVALAVVALLALPSAWAALRALRVAGRGFARPPLWVLVWVAALFPGLVVAALLALTPTLDPGWSWLSPDRSEAVVGSGVATLPSNVPVLEYADGRRDAVHERHGDRGRYSGQMYSFCARPRRRIPACT